MKKIICDRCGKEMESTVYEGTCPSKPLTGLNYRYVTGLRYTLTSRFGMSDTKQYDLCPDCQRDLYDWLNDGPDKVKPNGMTMMEDV